MHNVTINCAFGHLYISLLVIAMNEIQERPKRKLRTRNEVGTKHRPPKFGVCTSVYLSPLFSTEYRCARKGMVSVVLIV
jgi:hypothetical protein